MLEELPVNSMPQEYIILVQIPADEPLGKSDDDFCNTRVSSFSLDGEMVAENFPALIVPNGKLGTLKGGMLFLDDFRSPLSSEQVSGLAVECAQQNLDRRRRGLVWLKPNLFQMSLLAYCTVTIWDCLLHCAVL